MIMFDGTTTRQKRKQMDILLRFLYEHENQVVTKYSTSIHFPRAKAVDVTERGVLVCAFRLSFSGWNQQMDILLRFLYENENQVVTKYSTSIHFPRAKAVDVTERGVLVCAFRLSFSGWNQYQQSNF